MISLANGSNISSQPQNRSNFASMRIVGKMAGSCLVKPSPIIIPDVYSMISGQGLKSAVPGSFKPTLSEGGDLLWNLLYFLKKDSRFFSLSNERFFDGEVLLTQFGTSYKLHLDQKKRIFVARGR